jgi:hypothetical protein
MPLQPSGPGARRIEMKVLFIAVLIPVLYVLIAEIAMGRKIKAARQLEEAKREHQQRLRNGEADLL